MIDEHLFIKMQKLHLRHTFGANKPCFFLLDPGDLAYVDDRTKEERERYGLRDAGIFFNGIPCIESKLALPGDPLVVVKNPDFVE